MILNTTDSARLKTAIDAQNSFFNWMKNDTANVTNEAYANMRQNFIDWQESYIADELFITTGGGTQKLAGIDQVPIPPAR